MSTEDTKLLAAWLLSSVGFGVAALGLGRWLPPAADPWVGRLHKLTAALSLPALLLYLLPVGGWSLHGPGLGCGLLLLSGLLAGGRARRGRLPRRGLYLGQVALTALGCVGLLLAIADPPAQPANTVYQEAAYYVTLTSHRSWLSVEETMPDYNEAHLYRTYGGLLDHYQGQLWAEPPSIYETADPFRQASWWRTVAQLTQPADSRRLLVRRSDELVPLRISPPPSFFAIAPRPVAPAPTPATSPTPPPLPPAQDEHVYTYVDEPPRLTTSSPVGWRDPALGNAIAQRLAYSGTTPGVVFVRFTVTKAGTVRDIRIVKGLTASADSAVVAAVRRLPRLEPGRSKGWPLNVALTLPIYLPPYPPRTPAARQESVHPAEQDR